MQLTCAIWVRSAKCDSTLECHVSAVFSKMSLTKLSHACKVLPKITVRMKLRQSIWVQLGLLSALVTATGAASKPTECCIPSLVYTKRYWSKQSCVAGDLLELPHSAPSLVQPYSTIRTLSSDSSTDDGEDDPECHHWFDIDTDELVTMVKRSEEEEGYMLLIDVREPEELDQTGEIPGSINIPCMLCFFSYST